MEKYPWFTVHLMQGVYISTRNIISRKMKTRMQKVNGLRTGCLVANMKNLLRKRLKKCTGGTQGYDHIE